MTSRETLEIGSWPVESLQLIGHLSHVSYFGVSLGRHQWQHPQVILSSGTHGLPGAAKKIRARCDLAFWFSARYFATGKKRS